jgi:IS5 family transposase
MKQMSLSESGFERKTKRTLKREFLDEMSLVVPWVELVALIAPHAPVHGAKGARPPFAVETMLRIHFLRQWFNLSDPAMEEALCDTPMFREFMGLDAGEDNLSDESIILRFRHPLEAHDLSLQILATVNATLTAKGLLLKSGTVVDATLIAAPSSTKYSSGERDPEMHQTKKGNQWHFGMNAHIGVDATGQTQGIGQEHTDGRDHGPAGTGQGAHPGQGRTPVSGEKAPVRACEGSLPGTCQEHGAVAHAVCVEQLVDGAAHPAAGDAGVSAPESGQVASERGEIALQTADCDPKPPQYEITHSSSREAGLAEALPAFL